MAKSCLAELYQEQTKLCVYVCVWHVHVREGKFSVLNSGRSSRIPSPVLHKHSLKLEGAFEWKVMKFHSNRGRK